jgi:hypothetical protein
LQTRTASRAEQRYHQLTDPRRKSTWLTDVVLGGQDGLVNLLGMVPGVAAATGSARVILVAGLAAGFSGSVSMAAVAYTSTRAAADLFRSEREREYRRRRRGLRRRGTIPSPSFSATGLL